MGGWFVQSSPEVLVTKKISLLEIETESEISPFLALIICEASSFKILCDPNNKFPYQVRISGITFSTCLQNTCHIPPLGH